ncbi:MAG: tRNA (N6-isopentenyl adenosine(37)-C2)-methylthiotransferase MiaB [Sedimentisphaerales bacterium]|nr:tRNA (N6-isopentenyl adenosine(37)-C2)-methylthiotransferase MiaB [Sedimentisphaerales bacterium]
MKSEICNLKLVIKSFGCQMNKLDTALVASSLARAGFDLIDGLKEADVVLINTCSVRDHAEQRVISHLGHLKHIKESRPDLIVGVIGCMAQRLGDKLLEHEAVNIVCGPAQIPQIANLIKEAIEKNKKELAITEQIRKPAPQPDSDALEEFESAYGIDDKAIPGQAFVRVMRGCDKFCTYCIVPYVRGPEVSRPPEAIIDQIKRLADAGIKQVTLLGQAVNCYEYKAAEKTYSLADILANAADIEGIEWIKFVTNYPTEKYFDQILQLMPDSPKVCPYLHMPAQSGSDKILRAMNRRYTAQWYLDLLDKARSIVPDIAIAGDFIVGFPGETDDDFQATVELIKKARYKNCFVFKYSPRPGTTADKRLQDTVPPDVKQARNIELLAVQEKISEELSREFLGKTVKVLVEGPSKKPHLNAAESNNNPQLVARTATDHIVVFNAPESLAGRFATVRITKTTPLTLFAKLTESQE